ncbi:MAG: SAM-dependent chlorinase/fluorinase [Desulfomonile tiedjei]|nr:SAM-dependent chlorinase/fluorinase [Desulfomonile tiedjei]
MSDTVVERGTGRLNPIITLTTDFGTQDGFVAQMKGVILGINPNARLIDVTHDIEPFQVLHAALVTKGVSRYFPAGTIHVAVVDPGVGGTRRGMVLRCGELYFVGPDNGVFSLILSSVSQWEAREIANPEFILPRPHPTFHGRDLFAPVAAHLSRGISVDILGDPITDPVILPIAKPARTTEGLEGQVIYVDRFGNLTTNVEEEMLDRPISSVMVGDAIIKGISRFFSEVREGAPLALINSFGVLEIAVNRGNAASFLGLDIGSRVRVAWD